MKNTGILRHVDDMGRLVLPKEIRESMNLTKGTLLDIWVEGDTLLLRRHQSETDCAFCGKQDPSAKELNGHYICQDCLAKLRQL